MVPNTVRQFMKLESVEALQNQVELRRLYVIIISRTHYRFQSESTLYSCLNVREILARNRRDICGLSDSNGIIIYSQIHRTDKYSQHNTVI